MKIPIHALFLTLVSVEASIGDRLSEFSSCCTDCNKVTCLATTPSTKYADNSINPISARLFSWDCPSDCNYKCQQKITESRIKSDLEVVQFYGKWPFKRVLGVTEFFSTVFSMANFYVNYINFGKIARFYRANEKSNPDKASMFYQYLILLVISMGGWICSSIFHIRDFPLTETLDYLGAGMIAMANFNAIFVRYFGLYPQEKTRVRWLFQIVLGLVLLGHYVKLYTHWDYTYNMRFNVFFGVAAVFLWISHSLDINRKYCEKAHIYSNSIYLLPHETRLLAKLNHIGLSRSKYIPLIPVALNIFLLSTVALEMVDFVPVFLLVDAHSLWHLCTIFPPLLWYDWNVWDIELSSRINA